MRTSQLYTMQSFGTLPEQQPRVVAIGGEQPRHDAVRRRRRLQLARVMVQIGVHEAFQRALAELGFPIGAPTGRYDNTTRDAVISYQASLGGVATGLLSRDQFSALFEGDPNVTVFIDTHVDNT